jgi:hypothetical protein
VSDRDDDGPDGHLVIFDGKDLPRDADLATMARRLDELISRSVEGSARVRREIWAGIDHSQPEGIRIIADRIERYALALGDPGEALWLARELRRVAERLARVRPPTGWPR